MGPAGQTQLILEARLLWSLENGLPAALIVRQNAIAGFREGPRVLNGRLLGRSDDGAGIETRPRAAALWEALTVRDILTLGVAKRSAPADV
jgi:hypothetical protein